MKNPKRAAELIAELKSLAENQFESHRIEVLEHDLESPPVVEVIDDTHQRFNGITYYKKKNGHYHGHISIQRAVYSYYYGLIPEGYNVHHLDENKSNNDVSNFLLLTRAEHQRVHHERNTGHFNLEFFNCVRCGKKFIAYGGRKNRFCSRKCKDEEKEEKNQETRICQFCGKEFTVAKWSTVKCCGNSCAQKLRHIDSRETKTCPICGTIFTTLKKYNQTCCSIKCSHKLFSMQHTETRKCLFCKKEFDTKKSSATKFCSRHCSAQYRKTNR